VSIAPLDAA